MITCKRLPLYFAVLFFLSFFSLAAGKTCHAQKLDVPYVPTPHLVVEVMLDVAGVGPGDYVIDLGSGDGRIVIAAAQRGAFGHGIDLNPVRVKEAEQNAVSAGVSDRVMFLEGDLFDADISRATVITMYLFQRVNLRLKPVLFKQLKPGTRIVSHYYHMGEWEADKHIKVNNRDVFYWIIPADLGGRWEWTADGEDYIMDVQQDFQKLNVKLNKGNRALQVRNPAVVGERISFLAEDPQGGKHYAFSAKVNEGSITGTMQIRSGKTCRIENWNATLRSR
jgi:SAM-dependent methyltransferase